MSRSKAKSKAHTVRVPRWTAEPWLNPARIEREKRTPKQHARYKAQDTVYTTLQQSRPCVSGCMRVAGHAHRTCVIVEKRSELVWHIHMGTHVHQDRECFVEYLKPVRFGDPR